MQAIYYLLALIAILVILAIAWVVNRSEALDERKEELDKYSAHLDERDNRIARDELELSHNRLEEVPLSARYVVTESDIIKYTTDKSFMNAVIGRVALTLSNDIARRFKPEEQTNERGMKVLVYRFKVRQVGPEEE